MYYRLNRLVRFEIDLYHVRAQSKGVRGGTTDGAYTFSLPPFSRFRNDLVSGDGYVLVHVYLVIALGLPLATSKVDGGFIIHVLSAPNCNGLSSCTRQGLLIARRRLFQEQDLRIPRYRLSHGLQLQSSALQDLASCAAAFVA